jgi:hypothetical protein
VPGRPPLTPVRRSTVGLLALAALSVGTASGCGNGAVPVEPAAPRGDAATACDALDQALPATLRDQPARPTVPESTTTAAWGDPAITLTCGVPRPAERQGDAQLFEIDGVTWFAQPLTRGTRFTSEERVANVRVDVPVDYRPEAEVLVDLAPAIRDAVPLVR